MNILDVYNVIKQNQIFNYIEQLKSFMALDEEALEKKFPDGFSLKKMGGEFEIDKWLIAMACINPKITGDEWFRFAALRASRGEAFDLNGVAFKGYLRILKGNDNVRTQYMDDMTRNIYGSNIEAYVQKTYNEIVDMNQTIDEEVKDYADKDSTLKILADFYVISFGHTLANLTEKLIPSDENKKYTRAYNVAYQKLSRDILEIDERSSSQSKELDEVDACIQQSSMKGVSQLRELTEDEISQIERNLSQGQFNLAFSNLVDFKDARLDNPELLARFKASADAYIEALRSKILSWRSTPWDLDQGLHRDAQEWIQFERSLKKEADRRAGNESRSQRLVTQFERFKFETPKGQFMQKLISELSHGNYQSAILLLHKHADNRFQLRNGEIGAVLQTSQVGADHLKQSRHDMQNNTVSVSRANENAQVDFQRDSQQFKETFDKFVSGERLPAYKEPEKRFDFRTDFTT